MAFLCKKVQLRLNKRDKTGPDMQCKKAFRKDMTTYEEADEYCPHCDNQYVSSLLYRALYQLTCTGD
jgi:hypothetical protein